MIEKNLRPVVCYNTTRTYDYIAGIPLSGLVLTFETLHERKDIQS